MLKKQEYIHATDVDGLDLYMRPMVVKSILCVLLVKEMKNMRLIMLVIANISRK